MKNHFSIEAERSIVEALRPQPGQEVVGAIFSTYSLDLLALLGVVLGLSGIDCTEVDADPIDLHRSLFRLNKRIVVLCQRGRIRSPGSYRRARILSALDRTIVEVPFDERRRSWHAKLALVAYTAKDSMGKEMATEWRFWMGSRNLTRSTDLDLGLMLVGHPTSQGKPAAIPGFRSALATLLRCGGNRVRNILTFTSRSRTKNSTSLPDLLNHLLTAIEWEAPPGVKVDQISARGEQGELADALQSIPQSSKGSLLLSAPFVDDLGLASLKRFIPWDKIKNSTLLSTSAALDSLECKPCNVKLRMSDYPPVQHLDGPVPQSDDEIPEETPDADDSPSGRGLHAKLVLASAGSAPSILVLGSANLTKRGLIGGNAELIARLRVSRPQARELEQVLHQLSQEFEPPRKDPETIASEAVLKQLEAIRKELATDLKLVWIFGLECAMLQATEVPSIIPAGVRFEVAPFARPDLARPWPSSAAEISFGRLLLAEQGEFVILWLHDVSSGEVISWSQKAVIDGTHQELLDQRDNALAAELLTLQDIIRLIQAELAGRPSLRGAPWHKRRPPVKRNHSDRGSFADLQIEDLLRTRARNPEWSEQILSRVEGALEKLVENASEERVREAEAFLQLWRPFVAAFGNGA
jgi:hypothetical protein